MFKKALLTSLFLFLPATALASDLTITPGDIRLSVQKSFANEEVRIYATVRNVEGQDARGAVRFSIDGQQLGSDQPVSVVVGAGSTVFTDWTPSEGYYTVKAEVIGIVPADTDARNNAGEIKDFLVDMDTDGDRIGNIQELDDDNDGIDDGVEVINGTNPIKWDTDGDGVGDKDDAYPNDSSRSKKEIPVPSEPKVEEKITEPAKAAANTPAPKPVVKESSLPPEKAIAAQAEIDKIEDVIKKLPNFDKNLDLTIAKSRLNWRSWEFEALGAAAGANYLWDFGDRTLGEGRQAKHEFPGSGTYKITLSASDSSGAVGQIEETVTIGFWHLANIYVQIILGVLALGIIALIIALVFDLLPKYED